MNSIENTGKRTISATGEHLIKLELKYCERCGGLWVRQRGEMEARCRKCVTEEERLTELWRLRSHPVLPPTVKTTPGGQDEESPAMVAHHPPQQTQQRPRSAGLGTPQAIITTAELPIGAIQP